MTLSAIGEDDERMRENEEMRGFKKMRESGSEEKKEGREVFVERKREGSYEEYEKVRKMKRMKKKKRNGW